MVVNENREVAIRYKDSQPKKISGPSGRTYQFTVRAFVSLAWVHPSDVPWMLRATTGRCCGNRRVNMFHLANERDVQLFMEGLR